MKPHTCAFHVCSFILLAGLVACSSAKPTAPVQRSQTAPTPSAAESQETADASGTTAGDANKGQVMPADTTADKTPAPVTPATPPAAPAPALSLGSTAFANMTAIPAMYVAKNGGGNQSPPLQWKNPPAGTGSFAIQMVDLDFQTPPFIHWLIVNIPATSTQLPAAIPAGNNLAAPAEALGANQSKNYAGPNPPALHRYEWTVYAIKQGQTLTLGTNSATNKTELESKSLGKATLIGTYQ